MVLFSEVCPTYANYKLVNALTKFGLPVLTYFYYPSVSTKVFADKLIIIR